MKIFGLSVGAVIAIVVLIMGIAFGSVYLTSFYSKHTANTRGTTQQRENTQGNGAFRQAAYEEFFNLCTSAQTSQQQIKTLREDEVGATPDRVDRDKTSITALEMGMADSINQYNAKANEFHRAQFLDAKLPYPLSSEVTITCGS